MEFSMNTLMNKVWVILVICVPVTSPACPGGVTTTWCFLDDQVYIGVPAPAPIIGPSQETCQQQCLTSPTCKAVTHYRVTKSCTLYDTNHLASGALRPLSGMNYLYYVCGSTTCPTGEGSDTTTTTTQRVTPSTTTTTTPLTTTTTTPSTTTQSTTTKATSKTTQTRQTTKSTDKTTAKTTTTRKPDMEDPGYKPGPTPGDKITPEEFWIWVRDEPQWFAIIGFGFVVFIMFWIIMYLFYRIKTQKKSNDDD